MLCEACQEIFSNPGARGPVSVLFKTYFRRNVHHSPPSRLKEYANRGCYICKQIWKQLLPEEQQLVLSMSRARYLVSRLPGFVLLALLKGKERPMSNYSDDDWSIFFRVLLPDFIDFNGTYGWDYTHDTGELKFIFGASEEGWKTITFDILAADGKNWCRIDG